jgi:hypothetical protein
MFVQGGSLTDIPFTPDLILYKNLVAKGARTLLRPWPLSVQYWISLTSLMNKVTPCVL